MGYRYHDAIRLTHKTFWYLVKCWQGYQAMDKLDFMEANAGSSGTCGPEDMSRIMDRFLVQAGVREVQKLPKGMSWFNQVIPEIAGSPDVMMPKRV